MIKGIENQPVGNVQWIDRDELKSNDYNPNHVASSEFNLLKTSIKEDGWTQPIVARTDGEIVDGFHRWTVSGDPEIKEMTGGKVPVVFLSDQVSIDHQKMSTVRHNRARGSHLIVRMSDLIISLIDDDNVSVKDVCKRLGMETEEVERLYEKGKMTKRGRGKELSKGWVPDNGEKGRYS